MSFKKTAEGRVFFRGGETEGEEGRARSAPSYHELESGPARSGMRPGALSSAQVQAQIVGLLKALNERLKATQADRDRMNRELESTRARLEQLTQNSQRSERTMRALEQRLAAPAEKGAAADLVREALRELGETRKHLSDLQDKAERADRGVADLKNEILETRKISNQLIGKQTSLEKFSLEQAEKLQENASTFGLLASRVREGEQKQSALAERIEQTGAEQARLMRKLDKAIEDRARFVRKLERIEETLLHTRDSLNAKAMVLLTDQGTAGAASSLDRFDDEIESEIQSLRSQAGGLPSPDDLAAADAPWWRKPLRVQAAGLSALIVAGVMAGWLLSEWQTPDLPALQPIDLMAAPDPAPGLVPDEAFSAAEAPQASDAGAEGLSSPLPAPPSDTAAAEQPASDFAAAESSPVSMAEMDWAIPEAEQTAQAPEDVPPEQAVPEPAPADDIGTRDLSTPEEVVKLLNADSQTAGAALNALEPSIPAAAVAVPSGAPDPSTGPQQQATLSDPADLIKPDPALPPLVKQIEDQAFANTPEAQHDLAAIYTAGHAGVKQNYERAAFWFERAAERGIANAAYNLGVLYHQGLGVEPDLAGAIGWYQKAAALKHPEAQYNLGIAYIEGIGVGYDPDKAAAFFKGAAAQDITEAAYNLGLIYENGLLGKPQPDAALMWYKAAADRGSPEARQALQELAKSLNIGFEDVNRIAEGMKSAAAPPAQRGDAPKASLPAAPASAPLSAPASSKAQEAALVNTPPPEQVVTAQIQDMLMRMGLYPGPSDGATGPLTADAIRSYQKAHGLNPDGLATKNLLSHMLANAEPGENAQEQGSREN